MCCCASAVLLARVTTNRNPMDRRTCLIWSSRKVGGSMKPYAGQTRGVRRGRARVRRLDHDARHGLARPRQRRCRECRRRAARGKGCQEGGRRGRRRLGDGRWRWSDVGRRRSGVAVRRRSPVLPQDDERGASDTERDRGDHQGDQPSAALGADSSGARARLSCHPDFGGDLEAAAGVDLAGERRRRRRVLARDGGRVGGDRGKRRLWQDTFGRGPRASAS